MPLLLISAQVSDSELEALGSKKSTMMLIDETTSKNLLKNIKPETITAGGSVANSIAGIAEMGLKTAFIGKLSNDSHKEYFTKDMERLGVNLTNHYIDDQPTGHCIILITPDGERTMHTFIGAAAHITTDDICEDILSNSAYFFSESYVFDSEHGKDALIKACDIVHKHNGKTVLSLSDALCVQRHHETLKHLTKTYIDIILSNESEAMAMFKSTSIGDCITAMKHCNQEGVITLGEKGAIIIHKNEVYEVPATSVKNIIDLTGAGDQFAAGFLSGYALNKSAKQSGERGVLAASEVITHMGARFKNVPSALKI